MTLPHVHIRLNGVSSTSEVIKLPWMAQRQAHEHNQSGQTSVVRKSITNKLTSSLEMDVFSRFLSHSEALMDAMAVCENWEVKTTR